MPFFFDLIAGYCQYQLTDSDTENDGSMWCQAHKMLLIKTITTVLKVSTYIITSITARPIELAAVLLIITDSMIKTITSVFGGLLTDSLCN
jgi:hypothetical protein